MRWNPGAEPGPGVVELLDPVDEGRGQEVVLGREVAVDGAHGDVRPGRHVAHLDGLVAALEPELHGGVDDPLPTRFLSASQGTREGCSRCTGVHPTRGTARGDIVKPAPPVPMTDLTVRQLRN